MSDSTEIPVAFSDSIRPLRIAGAVMEWAGDSLVVRTRMPPSRHVLNVPAATVWLLCDGGRSPSAIASEIERVFPEEAARIPLDVERTLRDLSAAHLIRPSVSDQEGRRTLRVAFSNFAPDYDVCSSYFTWLLTHRYDVLLVDPSSGSPDVLFYSTARATGFDHRDADRTMTRKVLVTDGDESPDFSECDFAFSPHRVASADVGRHHRLPFGCIQSVRRSYARPGNSEHYAEDVICERLGGLLFEIATARDALPRPRGSGLSRQRR